MFSIEMLNWTLILTLFIVIGQYCPLLATTGSGLVYSDVSFLVIDN